MTTSRKPKSQPTWSEVKAKLVDFDRSGLLGLVQDMYATSKDNQSFLHVRLNLGFDILKPYKTTIDRWLWPDLFRNQDISVAKAKKAIADYKKAMGLPEGLAELTVFYCERAAGFSDDVTLQDEDYFDALVLMFEHAAKQVKSLPTEQHDVFASRLNIACQHCRNLGYGVYDDVRDILAKYGFAN